MGKKKGCGHRGTKEGRKKNRGKNWTLDLRAHSKTKWRKRDVDQIQVSSTPSNLFSNPHQILCHPKDEIKKVETTGKPMAFEVNEDLPG
jgi:hypothetical protein